MNDVWLFLGIIVFLFVLWVYSGGPNNPISFAGPYITPVTAPGSTQIGYGGSANQFFRPQNSGKGNVVGVIASARSPYVGAVRIYWSDATQSNPSSEYIHLHLTSTTDVDVTGWQLVGATRGVQVRIPQGSRGSSGQDIVLSPDYPDVYIVTGSDATDAVRSTYFGEWYAFLDSTNDIWQNNTDTITLLDQDGKVVDQYRY